MVCSIIVLLSYLQQRIFSNKNNFLIFSIDNHSRDWDVTFNRKYLSIFIGFNNISVEPYFF